MCVEVSPIAVDSMAEQNFCSKPRLGYPFAPEEFRSLRKGRADSHRRSNLSRGAFFLKFFGLIVSAQRVENRVELAIHHEIELMQGEPDAMVG